MKKTATTTTTPGATRFARHVQRRKAQGLVLLKMWLPPEVVPAVRQAADKLASEHVKTQLEKGTP